uniref:Uncharacterized protein n=1 Tax=viral metagenome TaxID=1070528 RepID=A0A6C0E737_9ZZZZ
MVSKQRKSKTQRKTRKIRGGSLASSRVESLVQPGCSQVQMPQSDKPSGDLSNVNLYQTTGGSRRKFKKIKGGSPASDYVMKYLNNPEHSYEHAFEGTPTTSKATPQAGGKKNKKNSKTKKNSKRGGGSSDWVSTHNSRSWTGGTGNQSLFNQFTSEEYMSGEQILKQLESNSQNVMLTGTGNAPVGSLTGGYNKRSKRSRKNKGKKRN